MKQILVIDAQGGGVGKQLVAAIKQMMPEVTVTAVGTNVLATQAMMKAGADQGATGENAVVVNCRHADIIAGPVGMVIADALQGEITPAMALAVARSRADRVLIPFSNCSNTIVGISDYRVGHLVRQAAEEIRKKL